jgi:hypothetical protein
MRKLKVLWRTARSPRVRDELEIWSAVLLALGAALLLYATLKAQAAHAAEFLAASLPVATRRVCARRAP